MKFFLPYIAARINRSTLPITNMKPILEIIVNSCTVVIFTNFPSTLFLFFLGQQQLAKLLNYQQLKFRNITNSLGVYEIAVHL